MNHIGFSVPNLRATVDKVKAAGYPVVTKAEVASDCEGDGRHRRRALRCHIAFVMGPDDVKVELVEAKTQTQPVALHHLHFFGQQNKEMRAWYAKTFAAKPRDPGQRLRVGRSAGRRDELLAVAGSGVGTAGRSLDHIGFEVKNLEAFTKQLEAQGIKLNIAYRSVPAINTAIAFITDPWGTYIELTKASIKVQ
jgi:catechol 2,3-dioxygenase-like lactoylglutathione lyase family enzyme